MKKRISALALALIMVVCLTGCVGIEQKVSIHTDGSVELYQFVGYDKEFYETYKDNPDVHFDELSENSVEKIYNGRTYIGDEQSMSFNSITELNESSDGTIYGGAYEDGYFFAIAGVQDAMGDATTNVETEDNINYQALLDSMYAYVVIEFPWVANAKEANIPDWITIDGNTVKINMIKADNAEHIFYATPSGKSTEAPVIPVTTEEFTDVFNNDWYFKAVEFAHNKGYVNGYPSGGFGPKDTLTVSQFAQILYNIAGKPEQMSFSNYWAEKAIWYGAGEGIVDTNKHSWDFTQANYDVPITREEAFYGLINWVWNNSNINKNEIQEKAIEVRIPDEDDINEGYWMNIMRAYALGLTSGVDSTGAFNPTGVLTRAEICQMIYNLNAQGII